MAAETRTQLLRDTTVEEINQGYKDGDILAIHRQRLLREKAHVTVADVLADKGYFGAVWSQTIKHAQTAWDDFVAGVKTSTTPQPVSPAAQQSPSEAVRGSEVAQRQMPVSNDLMGRTLWAALQMAVAPVSAIGEVSGQKVENMALSAGASPGLARVLNIVTDVGSGFMPVGSGVKAGVTAIKGTLESVAPKFVERQAAARASAIAKGLELDGVKATEAAAAKAAQAAAQAPPEVGSFIDAAKAASADANASAKLPTIAKRFGLDPKEARTALGLTSDKQLYGYLTALEPHVEQLSTLAKAAIAPGATEVEAVHFAKYATDLFTAGSAGKIDYSKRFMDFLIHWDPESVASGNISKAMRTFAEDIAVMSPSATADGSNNLAQFVVKNQSGFAEKGAGWWPMAREVYVNSLLPFAWIPTFIGNSYATGLHIAERMTGAMFSASDTGLVAREPLYYAKGMTLAFGDALKAIGNAFVEETPGKLDFEKAIPGVLGHIVRAPQDVVGGMDNFFKVLTRRGAMYSSAIRDGVHAGYDSVALGEHVANAVAHPTDAMVREAEELALTISFQNELGRFATNVRGALQWGPGVLYFPFMKSAINLGKYAWNRTPGLQMMSGQLYKDILAGGERADMAIGRITMSYMTAGFYYELAKEGYITGSGPLEPGLQKSWKATHEPYSIKTPEGWMPVTNMDPASQQMGLVADFTQTRDQLDDETASQTALALAFSVMKNIGDNTWWHSASTLVDAIQGIQKGEDIKKQGRDFALSPLTTLLGGGVIPQRVAHILDPVSRETKTIVDTIINKYPGLSATLPPLRDGYGDPVVPPQAMGSSWFGMLRPLAPRFKENQKDPIKIEGDRLSIKLPQFGWNVGGQIQEGSTLKDPLPGDRTGVELTVEQRNQWQDFYQALVRHPEFGIKALMDQPYYQEGTLAWQRQIYQSHIDALKKNAEDILISGDADLQRKIAESELKRVLPTLPPQDRPAMKQQVEEGMSLFETLTPQEQRNLLRMGELPIGLPDVGQPKTDVTVESPRTSPRTPVVAPPVPAGVAPAPTQTPPGGGMYQGGQGVTP